MASLSTSVGAGISRLVLAPLGCVVRSIRLLRLHFMQSSRRKEDNAFSLKAPYNALIYLGYRLCYQNPEVSSESRAVKPSPCISYWALVFLEE
ncbi:hypothetical protein E5288_WYG019545 [Bos mutus]|uniref:Uncharacterized protein n=1 Tax=Bos mutus TaxID=72004 RepID=A0A6B0RT27_9CETA|nr:hypothetical protein [Bos mutus]